MSYLPCRSIVLMKVCLTLALYQVSHPFSCIAYRLLPHPCPKRPGGYHLKHGKPDTPSVTECAPLTQVLPPPIPRTPILFFPVMLCDATVADGKGRCSHGDAVGGPVARVLRRRQGHVVRPPLPQAGHACRHYRRQRAFQRDSREFHSRTADVFLRPLVRCGCFFALEKCGAVTDTGFIFRLWRFLAKCLAPLRLRSLVSSLAAYGW